MTTIVETPRIVSATATANGALASGHHTPVNASAGALTMTLPTSVTPGSHLSVEKIDTSTNPVAITGTIRGAGGSVSLVLQYESVTFVADSTGSSWWPTAGHKTKASLDGLYQSKPTTGTASSSTFLRGDGSWAVPAGGASGAGSTYLSTIGTAAANTTAINNALTAAYTAGGGTVLLGPGTWPHTGIVMPVGGTVTLAGSGQDATVLSNTSTTATSISVLGQGAGTNPSRPYAQGWTIRDLSCTTATGTVNTNQVGIDVVLAVQYTMRSVRVSHHDIGYRFNSVWETTHQALTATFCGAAGYQFIPGFAGSTPVSFNDCHALNGSGVGASFAGDVNAVSWFGGDFVANTDGMTIQSSTARLISIYGVNFEGQSGTDVIVGSSSIASGSVLLRGTRHFRGTTRGTTAIDFVNGGALTVDSAYFSNFTNAIHQTNVTGQLEWSNLVTDNTTNFVNSQTNGVLNVASGQVVPGGYVVSDAYSGLAASVGLGIKPGDRKLRITSGYMLANSVGVDGDITINTAGAAGARFYIRTSGTWTAIPGI